MASDTEREDLESAAQLATLLHEFGRKTRRSTPRIAMIAESAANRIDAEIARKDCERRPMIERLAEPPSPERISSIFMAERRALR